MSVNLFTLFSCPKPFAGHDALIQTNALRNWRFLGADIILLGDDYGVAEAAAAYGCLHIAEVQKTGRGTPLLSDIFARAQAEAKTPLMCYSNADILYPPMLSSAAAAAREQLGGLFLLVGQRWDVDIERPLADADFTESGLAAWRKKGKRHLPWAIDYFMFPRGAMTLPPLAVGRPGWDNWMIWDAGRRGICVVDATEAIGIVHQNHGYAHVPGGIGQKWLGSPEADYNKRILTRISPAVQWGRITVRNADKRLTRRCEFRPGGKIKKWTWAFFLYRQDVKNRFWGRRALLKNILGARAYAWLKKVWRKAW